MKAAVLVTGAFGALMAGAAVFLLPAPPADLPGSAFQAVTLGDGRVLHVQQREVSVALWNRCHGAGACPFALPAPADGGAADYPATGISHADAMTFTAWFSAETGHAVRLPSMPEWRSLAREVLPETPAPLFSAPELSWAQAYSVAPGEARKLQPAGSGAVSEAGIADLANNVWEWTSDCASGADADRCPAYFAGGLHEAVIPFLVRDPARGGCAVGAPPPHLGMRLVLDRAEGM